MYSMKLLKNFWYITLGQDTGGEGGYGSGQNVYIGIADKKTAGELNKSDERVAKMEQARYNLKGHMEGIISGENVIDTNSTKNSTKDITKGSKKDEQVQEESKGQDR